VGIDPGQMAISRTNVELSILYRKVYVSHGEPWGTGLMTPVRAPGPVAFVTGALHVLGSMSRGIAPKGQLRRSGHIPWDLGLPTDGPGGPALDAVRMGPSPQALIDRSGSLSKNMTSLFPWVVHVGPYISRRPSAGGRGTVRAAEVYRISMARV
jgi:hypothetical protein